MPSFQVVEMLEATDVDKRQKQYSRRIIDINTNAWTSKGIYFFFGACFSVVGYIKRRRIGDNFLKNIIWE